jgi:hypothetical protein
MVTSWQQGLSLLVLAIIASAVSARATTARIVVSRDAPPSLHAASQYFQAVIEQSTGTRFPIAARHGAGLALHLGRTEFVVARMPDLSGVERDGFVRLFLDERNYAIVGVDAWATEFGMYDFLEDVLEVRWLMPGPEGTVIPTHATLAIPRAPVRESPAFWSRYGSGFRTEIENVWARRMRQREHVDNKHFLWKLFPPIETYRAHPTFMPLIDGQRYQPTGRRDWNWQPNFLAAGIAAEAADRIRTLFQRLPEQRSVSLAVNDSHRFDQSPESLAVDEGGRNAFGYPNRSNSYYRWCNAVAQALGPALLDRYLGCLAYVEVAAPPAVDLHPRVIPFLTADRLMWADPQGAERGKAWTRAWNARAEQIGWYDYLYGQGYCLPRVYPHLMAQYLRFGHQNSVRVHYAECYPHWAEGPKLYVHFKLLWDPTQDVDALLDDWYNACVGEEAAPHLREYYAIWERFWTQDAPQSKWWGVRRHYLPFNTARYLAAVDLDDIDRSRALLEACVAKAQTKGQKTRAEKLLAGFRFYEASAYAYNGNEIAETIITTEQAALDALQHGVQSLAAAERRLRLVRQYEHDPLLKIKIDPARQTYLRGDPWGRNSFWTTFGWVSHAERVRAKIEALGREEGRVAYHARLMQQALDPPWPAVLPPLTFEQREFGDWKPLNEHVARGGQVRVISTAAHAGDSALLCADLPFGGAVQELALEPGDYLLKGFARVDDYSESGKVVLSAVLRDAGSTNLLDYTTGCRPPPGKWWPIACPFTVSAEVVGRPIKKVLLVAGVRDFEGGRALLDSVQLYRVDHGSMDSAE